MSIKTTLTNALILPLVVSVSFIACDNDPTGPGGGDDGDGAAVAGEVESTHDSPSGVAPAATSSRAAAAETVALGTVQSNGSLNVIAEADVAADGTFRIEGLDAGQTDLVVVARASGGADVGRVIVHGQTQANQTINVAPIDARTTARGRVHAELVSSGRSGVANSGAEMNLFLQFESDASAAAVATSNAQLQAMANAFAEAQATMDAVLAAYGSSMNASARANAWASAAESFQASLAAGATVEAALATYADAAVSALIQAQTTAEAAAVAAASAATTQAAVAAQSSVEAGANAGTTASIAGLNLRARERLVADVSSGATMAAAASTIETALIQAQAQVANASTRAEVQAILDAQVQTGKTAVGAAFGAIASSLTIEQLTNADAALQAAFETADLKARLAGVTTASAAASATASYEADVEAAAQAVIDTMEGSGVNITVSELVAIFVAASGNASVS